MNMRSILSSRGWDHGEQKTSGIRRIRAETASRIVSFRAYEEVHDDKGNFKDFTALACFDARAPMSDEHVNAIAEVFEGILAGTD